MNEDRVLASLREKGEAALTYRKANRPEHIDNGALPAGANMTFYCVACGHIADIKPEEYLFPVRKMCSECEGLAQLKLLKRIADEV
jgi:hypothetical protein